MGNVQLLDVHSLRFGCIVIDFAQPFFGSSHDLFANEFKLKLHNIFESDQFILGSQRLVIIYDKTLLNEVADILIEQNKLLFLVEAILAVKALDFEIVRVDNGRKRGCNLTTGSEAHDWLIEQ